VQTPLAMSAAAVKKTEVPNELGCGGLVAALEHAISTRKKIELELATKERLQYPAETTAEEMGAHSVAFVGFSGSRSVLRVKPYQLWGKLRHHLLQQVPPLFRQYVEIGYRKQPDDKIEVLTSAASAQMLDDLDLLLTKVAAEDDDAMDVQVEKEDDAMETEEPMAAAPSSKKRTSVNKEPRGAKKLKQQDGSAAKATSADTPNVPSVELVVCVTVPVQVAVQEPRLPIRKENLAHTVHPSTTVSSLIALSPVRNPIMRAPSQAQWTLVLKERSVSKCRIR
jgi:hypothetical protein